MPHIPVGINTYAGDVGLITQCIFKIFLFELFPLTDLMFYKKDYFVIWRGFSDAMEKQAFVGFYYYLGTYSFWFHFLNK